MFLGVQVQNHNLEITVFLLGRLELSLISCFNLYTLTGCQRCAPKCGNCQGLLDNCAPTLPSVKYEKPIKYVQDKIPEAQPPQGVVLVSVLLP